MSARAHGRFLELAAASLDFALSQPEQAELAQHIEACRSCSLALQAMQADARAIRALPLRPLPLDRAPVILSRALGRRPDLHALRLVALAAALALLGLALVTAGNDLVRRREAIELGDPRQSVLAPSAPLTAWQAVAPMSVPRGGHTATLLPDGRVLVAGGSSPDILRSAEIFDPQTGDWSAAAEMFEARVSHVAVVLPDGDTLVIGGHTGGGLSSLSERFSDDSWSPGPTLSNARADFAAMTTDGRVFVIGGIFGDGLPRAEVEIWQVDGPLEFGAVQSLETPRSRHTATLLADGRILVVGGLGPGVDQPLATVELFDPSSLSWRTVAGMALPRYGHTASLLSDGRVLVVGGFGASGAVLAGVEIYDPADDTWTSLPPLGNARAGHGALVVDGVNVLVFGGRDADGPQASTEWFDGVASSWAFSSGLLNPRQDVVAVRLPDGSAMVIGGDTSKGGQVAEVEVRAPTPGT